MTNVAGVRDFQRLAQGGADKAEGVAANVHIAERLGDLGHVAGDALAAGAVSRMMRMFRDAGRVRAVGRIRSVAIEAQGAGRFA